MDENYFFDEVLKVYDDNNKYPPRSEEELTMLETIARHFYSLGLDARKKESVGVAESPSKTFPRMNEFDC